MKMTSWFTAVVLGIAMMLETGCGNNSSNPPASTNAVVSGAVSSTNEIIVNAPPAALTNAPTLTNSVNETNK